MGMTRPSLLRRIQREHPEWLESAEAPAEPVGGREGSFLVTIPSSDRRPEVDVEIWQNEALIRAGRHEQLFVWPPEDADEAEREVIAYAERITRSTSDPESICRDGATLREEQRELLARIDDLLRERGAYSDVRFAGPPGEPHAALTLLLPPERSLDVRILIGADSLELHANTAVSRLDRIHFGDHGPSWVAAYIRTMESLVAHDLIFRIRRTLTFGRAGAIRIPGPDGTAWWNGDPFACMGMGRVRVVAAWWSPT